MIMATLVDSQGIPVSLGQEIKSGGEGTIYEVFSRRAKVAKIYGERHLPDAAKRAKLTFMTATGNEKLHRYIAWPERTLSSAMGGRMVGFLMQKVEGWLVADSYHPATRKRCRPQDSWEFLLHVARNVAAAFDTVHEHGHVLGDVNHGNVMVRPDSTVVLIDSDSYQINVNGALHLCGVGVREFVPPELQGLASLSGAPRTANHDNFGLAVLIFQLLFSGRHPYAGRPIVDEAGNAVEQDIKAFRYAYARDARARGILPPPSSVPISLVPGRIEEMFFRAFTEMGVLHGRPTAAQWCEALDEVRKALRTCISARAMHVYPAGLGHNCPWCRLEGEGVQLFLAPPPPRQRERAPPPDAQAPPRAATTEDRGVAVLAYITLIGFISALVMHRNASHRTALGAHHLRQVLGLSITVTALWIFGILSIPFLGALIQLGLFVLWLLGFLAAIRGQRKPVPLLGKLYEQILAGIVD
jgi:DNA-binding helix-hairpin-helix protein with protein kinase domain